MVNSYMQLQEYYREKELVFNLTNVSKVQVLLDHYYYTLGHLTHFYQGLHDSVARKQLKW